MASGRRLIGTSPNRVKQKQQRSTGTCSIWSISISYIRTVDTCEDVALSNSVEDVSGVAQRHRANYPLAETSTLLSQEAFEEGTHELQS